MIDLDGTEARERWAGMGRTPATWITHSGAGGWHAWLRLPADYPRPLPKGFLWRGEGKHQAIERLGDYSLVIVPPSLHPATGERYRFLDASHSPKRLPMPTACPAWILALPLVGQTAAPRALPRAADILAAVPDKIALARSWGVRFAGGRTPRGWWPCHAIDRDDRHPSAAVNETSGSYCDLGSGQRLGFFDLGASLGIYRDWKDAADHIGRAAHVR